MRNLVTAEMAELLITLAQDSEAWAQDWDGVSGCGPSEAAEQARAIAAEIQEALKEQRSMLDRVFSQLEPLSQSDIDYYREVARQMKELKT